MTYEERMRQGGSAAIEEASRFLMGEGPVHVSLAKIARRLEQLGIPYAVVGGMALVAHGYDRTTVDVDILVTAAGLAATHQALEGLGYVPPFAGSKHLRDTETSVRIEFLVAGQYPGDGKPKEIAFPDPARVSVVIDGIRYVNLPTLIELKLASGISNPLRAKDIGDVIDLIKVLRLPVEFGQQLNPYVRERFVELVTAIAAEPREEP